MDKVYAVHPYRLYDLIPFFVFSAALFVVDLKNSLKEPTRYGVFLIIFFILLSNYLYMTRPVYNELHVNDIWKTFEQKDDPKTYSKLETELAPYIRGHFPVIDLVLTNQNSMWFRYCLDYDNVIGQITDISKFQKVFKTQNEDNSLFVFFRSPYPDAAELGLYNYLNDNYLLLNKFNYNTILVFRLTRLLPGDKPQDME